MMEMCDNLEQSLIMKQFNYETVVKQLSSQGLCYLIYFVHEN